MDSCYSYDPSERGIPSFIEPCPPLINNPFMRPKPQKATNLMELLEDSEREEPELVQVYLRLKPCNVQNYLYEVRSDKCLITSVDPAAVGHGRRAQHSLSKLYTFSHIFRPESTQKEIFEHVVKNNLKKLPEGHSFTLLTYGASGSGKTYTLMGTVAAPGLVPRSLEYLFRVVDAAQQPLYKPGDGGEEKLSYAQQKYELQWVKRLKQISAPMRDKYRRMSARLDDDLTGSTMDLSNRVQHYVWVSFVEIYNEGVYDLLVDSDRRLRSKLRIREGANGNVYVKGATQAFVRTGEEAYDVLVAGKHNLQVAATGVHAHSSRSHCIFTITTLTETENGLRTSSVRLCDLAGSERAQRTHNTGLRMQESRAINTSLHVLERCLHMLQKNQRHGVDCNLVPYRESKLTRLLGAGLSGARGEAVSMVVTVNPSPDYAYETKHVLQLATVARDIQVNQTIATESSLENSQDTTVESSVELMRVRAENERLHFEIIQCQSRIKELEASEDRRRQRYSEEMSEAVEEAKAMIREYYEAEIKSIKEWNKIEIEEITEKYEKKLTELEISRVGSSGTLLLSLQNQITALIAGKAILEEKLNAERLTNAALKEDIQQLRACIEERNENIATMDASIIELKQKQCLIVVNDSYSDSDNETDDMDIANESLEPIFSQKDTDRSRLLRKTEEDKNVENLNVLNNSSHNFEIKDYLDNNSNATHNYKGNNEFVDQTNDIHDIDVSENCGGHDGGHENGDDHTSTGDGDVEKSKESFQNCDDTNNTTCNEDNIYSSENYKILNNEHVSNEIGDLIKHNEKKVELLQRETYFVINAESITVNNECKAKLSSTKLRQTYFVADARASNVSNNNKTNDDIDEDVEATITNRDNNNDEIKVPFAETFVSKVMTSVKPSSFIDNSLTQFEQIEMAAQNYEDASSNLELTNTFFADDSKLKVAKQKKTYFDNIDVEKSNVDHSLRSTSIIKDDLPTNYIPTTIKKLLGEVVTRKQDLMSSEQKTKMLLTTNESVDMFEGLDSPHPVKDKVTTDDVDIIRKSVDNLHINNQTIKQGVGMIDLVKKCMVVDDMTCKKSDNQIIVTNESKETKNEVTVISERQFAKENNTTEDFENIYKEITTPRPTEFELLVLQDINVSKLNETELKHNPSDTVEPKTVTKSKYNLRRKKQYELEERIEDENENDAVKNFAKSESKYQTNRSKKNLRHKAQTDDIKPEDSVNLRDIVNFQREYCDVTLDIPAVEKKVIAMSSPERSDNENVPPLMGMQSCPSKSVTRSKRKLFTPRPEPLDESRPQTGDSNERLCIPRPSYRRGRARRKL